MASSSTRAAGQRYQQLSRQDQHFPADLGRSCRVGFPAVQRA
ncbi:hypothetical protein [Streptomyces sp. NPDC048489]